uniref:Uncharacterized protein n=1 Tax=Tetranychus urticae TaxID=32264 RepID=T1KD70_TETUR
MLVHDHLTTFIIVNFCQNNGSK